jgi:RHS repeat-associated protein
VDGDGLADLVYVESGRVTLWLNQAGERWSVPIVIEGTPPVTDADAVRLTDLFGHGVAGVLWTYDSHTFGDSSYKFLDLAGGTKPYLLTRRDNNVGAVTLAEYVPSTRFYLEDQDDPRTRWRGRLPFPVQVIARTESIDQLSGGKLVSEYRYHQGYWDSQEREFRGFGLVEQLDTETFLQFHASAGDGAAEFRALDPVHFSPPILTRNWFHQGLQQDASGRWTESTADVIAWAGDPPMFSADQRLWLAGLAHAAAETADPLRLRRALRALRGKVLRTEVYARDGSERQDKPYTVTETLHDVREVDPGSSDGPPVFFPFEIASRTTQWERGDDPMVHFAFSDEPNAYGLPTRQLAVAVPRGRDPRAIPADASKPMLSSLAVLTHAGRDDEQRYMVDRVCRSDAYEVIDDGRRSAFGLRDAAFGGSAELRRISHARYYYDGEAFIGLPLGRLGDFGAPVRSESLAFTDTFLAEVDPHGGPPPWLQAAPVWTADYPEAFREAQPPLAGYVHYAEGEVTGCPGGYFTVTDRSRYDFHELGRMARGLVTASRDPMGAESSVEFDAHDLLPVRVVNAAGLATIAEYDYRLLRPRRVVDPNAAESEFRYSPTGMITEQYLRGAGGRGDQTEPSIRREYDFRAFARSGAPVSVHTIRRVRHDSDASLLASEDINATLQSVEYSDGFGRLLQTRTQADDLVFGDPAFGGIGLPLGPGATDGLISGISHPPGAPPTVRVSGWRTYDNKGRVVEAYEPFFARGWSYAAPDEPSFGQKVVTTYDARGRPIRTLTPDGSEERVVFGIPADLADPSVYAPTAWETFVYDVNDNAGRTHAEAAAAFVGHWNTPVSILVDALGRTVAATVRNGPDPAQDWLTTCSAYDIQGNLTAVTDARGRVAFRHVYDLARRLWRTEGVDCGRRSYWPGADGEAVEIRDSKGALSLRVSDRLGRKSRLWARDAADLPVTLRQVLVYGDAGDPAQPATERETARARNLLGQLAAHYDCAGLLTIQARDFKGNVVEKSRRLFADEVLLSAFGQAPANGWRITPFQTDWQPAPGRTLAEREGELLEPAAYGTTSAFDAVNRLSWMQFPQDVGGGRKTLRPGYDDAGALAAIRLDDEVFVERIAYDAKGQRAFIARGDGVMTRYAYDPRTFRLRRLRSEAFAKPDPAVYAPSGTALQDLAYEYDLRGNVLRVVDRVPGSGVLNNPEATMVTGDPGLAQQLASGDAMVRRFAYDALYRLVSATGREHDLPPDGPAWLDQPRGADLTRARNYTERYRWDAMGGLLKLQHQAGDGGYVRDFTVEAESNRLQSMQVGPVPSAYVYDATGNLLAEGLSRKFEWTYADQMRSFATATEGAEPSVHAKYLYDAAGQRLKKLVRKQGGQIETTVYIDGVFEHHRWSAGGGGENNWLHMMESGHRIALLRVGPAQTGDTGPQVQFHLADHLGSSALVLDPQGQFVSQEEYLPFGETAFGGFARKRYRFTGMERDEESGLAYHSARFLAPYLARWLSTDPVAKPAETAYGYAAANPIGLVDPTGADPQGAPAPQAAQDFITAVRDYYREVSQAATDSISTAKHNFRLNIDRGTLAGNVTREDLTSILGTDKFEVKYSNSSAHEIDISMKDIPVDIEFKRSPSAARSKQSFAFESYARENGRLLVFVYGNGSEAKTSNYLKKALTKGQVAALGRTTGRIQEKLNVFSRVGGPSKGGGASLHEGGPGTSSMAGEERALIRRPQAGSSNLMVMGGLALAAGVTMLLGLAEGRIPGFTEVAVSVVPGADIAMASNHNETVVPIMCWAVSQAGAPEVCLVLVGGVLTLKGAEQTVEKFEEVGSFFPSGISQIYTGGLWDSVPR